MPSNAEIYLCRYEHRESFYLRHFISSISYCNILGTISMDSLRRVIEGELLDKLLKDGEVVITDTGLIRAILGKEPVMDEYLVLKKCS